VANIFRQFVSNDLINAVKILKGIISGEYTFIGFNPANFACSFEGDIPSREEIEEHFSDLPSETRQQFVDWFQSREYCRQLYGHAIPVPYYFCIIARDIAPGNFDWKSCLKEHRTNAKLQYKYQFRDKIFPGPESLYHHHGLKYLPSNVIKRIAQTDFIDAGAFAGDSSLVLSFYSPEKIYAFEPSLVSGGYYESTMRKNGVPSSLYELVPKGVGEKQEVVFIDDTGSSSMLLSGSFQGAKPVEFISVDDFADERKLNIGLIKADVEGMALAMLRGAQKTICRNRPLLLISILSLPRRIFRLL
jgi:FkbM family methyltransferase